MTPDNLIQTHTWQALQDHYQDIKDLHLRDLFKQDPDRGTRLTVQASGLYMDYAKHRITDETLRLLFELARERGLEERRDAMFRGEKINLTEDLSACSLRECPVFDQFRNTF